LLLDEPLWPLDGLIWLDMQRLIETLWLKNRLYGGAGGA
jgi:ABC-type nitrate/sulfonate/bicarbonate transport system ATPase subunit